MPKKKSKIQKALVETAEAANYALKMLIEHGEESKKFQRAYREFDELAGKTTQMALFSLD